MSLNAIISSGHTAENRPSSASLLPSQELSWLDWSDYHVFALIRTGFDFSSWDDVMKGSWSSLLVPREICFAGSVVLCHNNCWQTEARCVFAAVNRSRRIIRTQKVWTAEKSHNCEKKMADLWQCVCVYFVLCVCFGFCFCVCVCVCVWVSVCVCACLCVCVALAHICRRSSSDLIEETLSVQQAARGSRHKSGLRCWNPLLKTHKLLIDLKSTNAALCLQSASVHELQLPRRNQSLSEVLEISLRTDAEAHSRSHVVSLI